MHGLTQHFEQMTKRSSVTPMDMGHLPDQATAEVSQISLNHDEVSMEYHTGHIFPAYEFSSTGPESRNCLLCGAHRKAPEEAVLLAILLEEMCDRDKV